MKMTDCKGSLTVEMTLLFLSVFFLLVLLLRALFGLGSTLFLHSLEERALMIWQGAEAEEKMEDNLSSIVRSYCQSSPLPFRYQNLRYEMTNSLLGTEIQLQLQGEFTLWTGGELGTSRSAYRIESASWRNHLDAAWEIGEELPVLGNLIQNYEEELRRIQKKLEETGGQA